MPEYTPETPMCAHLRVTWRTEQLPDGFTRGWWECDYGCGAKFIPEARLAALERYIKATEAAAGPCDWDCTDEEMSEYEAAKAALAPQGEEKRP